MFGPPKAGKQDDKAHPPIHPVKNAPRNDCTDNEWRIYDLLARHFLATLSKAAVGSETVVRVTMGGEYFTCRGLLIEQMNWLDVFPFEKWADSTLPKFYENMVFKPSALKMAEGETVPPKYLSESDLIDKMDKNGIGTDATIHEHIKNVQEREYVKKQNQSLVPTNLGSSLVDVYAHFKLELYKPYLRAQMEADMRAIADGTKPAEEIYKECLGEMRKIFNRTQGYSQSFKEHFTNKYYESGGRPPPPMNNGGGYNQGPGGGGGYNPGPGGGGGGGFN